MLWTEVLFPMLAALSGLLLAYSYFVTGSRSSMLFFGMALAVSSLATLAVLNLKPQKDGGMEEMEAIRKAFKREMKGMEEMNEMAGRSRK